MTVHDTLRCLDRHTESDLEVVFGHVDCIVGPVAVVDPSAVSTPCIAHKKYWSAAIPCRGQVTTSPVESDKGRVSARHVAWRDILGDNFAAFVPRRSPVLADSRANRLAALENPTGYRSNIAGFVPPYPVSVNEVWRCVPLDVVVVNLGLLLKRQRDALPSDRVAAMCSRCDPICQGRCSPNGKAASATIAAQVEPAVDVCSWLGQPRNDDYLRVRW